MDFFERFSLFHLSEGPFVMSAWRKADGMENFWPSFTAQQCERFLLSQLSPFAEIPFVDRLY